MKYPKIINFSLFVSLLISSAPSYGKQFVLRCVDKVYNGKPIIGEEVVAFLLKFDTVEKTFQYQDEKSIINIITSGKANFWHSYISFDLIKKGSSADPDLEVHYLIDRTDLTFIKSHKSNASNSRTAGICKITPEFRPKKNLI